jgi:hypothetical protein
MKNSIGKKLCLRFGVLVAMSVASTAAPVQAAESDFTPETDSVTALLDEVTALRAEVQDLRATGDSSRQAEQREVSLLRAEVKDLRAAGDQNWLTERRAEEVRAMILDILADADTRASLLADNANAGWDNGFFLQSSDGAYLMKIGGLLQYRWVGTFRDDGDTRTVGTSLVDDTETGFEFRRVELVFTGHIGSPSIGYLLVLATEDGEAGVEDIIAQDVRISYDINDNFTVAGGRYFGPFLREELIGGGGSLAVALSFMNNTLSIGRVEGVELKYQSDDVRASLMFSDGAGSGGGGAVNNHTADASDWAVTFRGDVKLDGEWGQWGDFSAAGGAPTAIFIGGAIHAQGGEHGDDVAGNDTDLLHWTADASYENNGLAVYFAFASNHSESSTTTDIDNTGWVVQAGYMLVPDKIEPFVRYETMSFDSDLGYVEDDVSMITVGVNIHNGTHGKFAVDMIYAMDPIPADSLNAGLLADGTKDGQVVARAQYQLKF